jgi:hypothetical protein
VTLQISEPHFLPFIAMDDECDDDNDDDDNDDTLLIVTDGELLHVGLELIVYTEAMVLRASQATNEERFQRLDGSSAFASGHQSNSALYHNPSNPSLTDRLYFILLVRFISIEKGLNDPGGEGVESQR